MGKTFKTNLDADKFNDQKNTEKQEEFFTQNDKSIFSETKKIKKGYFNMESMTNEKSEKAIKNFNAKGIKIQNNIIESLK